MRPAGPFKCVSSIFLRCNPVEFAAFGRESISPLKDGRCQIHVASLGPLQQQQQQVAMGHFEALDALSYMHNGRAQSAPMTTVRLGSHTRSAL